ncbi:MAG: homoserine dehydrogenase [Tissierellaceae bacterium]|nr:homoserine dehydrogenase [Tissierellaceae bacterium]
MDIGLIGFGGVGKALIKSLIEKRNRFKEEGIELNVKYILSSQSRIFDDKGINIDNLYNFMKYNNDISKYPNGGAKVNDFHDIINSKKLDLIIEMTPSNLINGEPGYTYIKTALENKINVITSNKGPIALHYNELYKIASRNNVQLAIGCTTGGALPTINGGIIDLAGSDIFSIEGVLNGTSNFILEEMENNQCDFDTALKEALRLGIAEPTNPSQDVEGKDAAAKLLILTNVLLKQYKKFEDIDIEGITKIKLEDIENLKKNKKRYKLIATTTIEKDKLKMTVKPEIVDIDNIFYHVNGKNKAVKYKSDTLGELFLMGGASGVEPAAASILRDLVNLSRGYKYIR